MIKKLMIIIVVVMLSSTIISLSAWTITKLIKPPPVTIKVMGRTLPGELNTIIWLENGLGYIVLDSLETHELGVKDSVNVYITFHIEE